MPSSATPLGNMMLQAAGEGLNVWGDPNLNNVITQMTEYIAGQVSFALSGSKTLTSTNYVSNEARNMMIVISSGTGGTVTIPSQTKVYLVINGASGSVTITTGGLGAVVLSGQTAWVRCDGTDCYLVRPNDFGSTVVKSTYIPAAAADLTNKLYVDTAITNSTAGAIPGGSNGQFLATVAGSPAWANIAISNVTSLQSTLTTMDTATATVATNLATLDGQAEKTANRATAAEIRNDTNKHIAVGAAWDSVEPVTLTYASSYTPDMSTFINATMTLTGNLTLNAPTNAKAGQAGFIQLIQDGTGSRTATFNSAYKFNSGIKTLTTTAGASDYVFYQVISSSLIVCTLVKAPS